MPLFWKVWKIMEKKYPFKEPKNDEKVYDAIQGLVASYGDEHSVFFPPKYSQQFQEEVDGKFGGAGMEVTAHDGYFIVIAPLKNSPAEKAGVKPGDIIIEIDGQEVAGKDFIDVINLIRGKVGTTLNLTVLRPDDEKKYHLNIVRDIIKIPVLSTHNIDDVFVISLYNFNNEAIKEFKSALKDFKKSHKPFLLLDLRNNPGGYLSEAIDLLSYFIDKGKIVVREDYGDVSDDRNDESRGFQFLKDNNFRMGVLINKGSASASEIVAGALQDYKKASIIGETSYGKGSVQELIDLNDNTSLKVTIAKWLTPLGHQISQKGISPDINIEDMSNKDDDEVLHEAVSLLKNKK